VKRSNYFLFVIDSTQVYLKPNQIKWQRAEADIKLTLNWSTPLATNHASFTWCVCWRWFYFCFW